MKMLLKSRFQFPPPPRLRVSKPLLFLVGTTALILGSSYAGWVLGKQSAPEPSALSAQPTQPVSVETMVVKRVTVENDRTLTGNVEPEEAVTLTSRVPGYVQSLAVKEGDRVNAGQLIARIDVSDIVAQRNQALAAVNVAQSGHRTAVAQFNQAQAQLVEAQAELADAQRQQQRMAFLQAEGAESRSMLDAANTRVNVIQAKIGQIQAGIRQAEAGIRQAEAQVKQAEAGVAEVSANLDYGTVTAPFSGVITQKLVEVGSMAGMGQAIARLESTERLRLSVSVPESLTARLQQGQPVKVHIDALNQSISGQVSQIIPSADPQSRNFTVKIALNSNQNLIPGMFGRLQLEANGRTALMVSPQAIAQRLGVSGVFKVINGNTQFQPITVREKGELLEVFSGLEEGDRIILNPDPNLLDNTPVSFR